MSALHRLARRGDPFELLALLEEGADPNEAGNDGRTPLMNAAKSDNRLAIRLLIRLGADVNAVAQDGRTALHDATSIEGKKMLLEAGADPDLGRIGGMTLMAFFASFRAREMVELLLSYGADPSAKIRRGHTVQELLDDPDYIWNPHTIPDFPDNRAKNLEQVVKMSDHLRITPERYVATNRNMIIWGYHVYTYEDPAVTAWTQRVGELFASPYLLEEAYRQALEGEELAQALKELERPKRREEKHQALKRKIEEFEARYDFERGVLLGGPEAER